MKSYLFGACAIALSLGAANAADMVADDEPAVGTAPAAVTEIWSLGGFSHPESVYEDKDRNALYVSNVGGAPLDKDGNGFISKISRDGKLETLKWIEGMNAPKGMVMKGNTLYVSDIDKLVEIDAAAGKIVNTYPAEGAVFLNDTAVDDAGNVYVSDIAKRKIWQLRNGAMTIWYGGDDLMHPNGLRVEGDKLIVAGWGRDMNDDGSTKTPGNLFTIDLATKKIANLGGGQGVGNLDGLERDAQGGFLVTDWFGGALYRIREDGTHDVLMDLNQGSADLEALDDGKTAVVPMMLDDKVTAFSVP
jgi:DNA-binding beta-propeller fold protein YncE